ncbi:MAG: hypothetical protein ACRCZF_21115, partial [Gemmataceae bacterium]
MIHCVLLSATAGVPTLPGNIEGVMPRARCYIASRLPCKSKSTVSRGRRKGPKSWVRVWRIGMAVRKCSSV